MFGVTEIDQLWTLTHGTSSAVESMVTASVWLSRPGWGLLPGLRGGALPCAMGGWRRMLKPHSDWNGAEANRGIGQITLSYFRWNC